MAARLEDFVIATLGNRRGRAYVLYLEGKWRFGVNRMTRSARIAVAAAFLLSGTSLATAKTRAHGKVFHPGINETSSTRGAAGTHAKVSHPGINETTSRPTAADPYYRLSDSYYGYSDPFHGLFDYFAVPPYNPGYNYGHMRPSGFR
jgi:hypothetical protein